MQFTVLGALVVTNQEHSVFLYLVSRGMSAFMSW